jgi:Cft2 family RNA processing exonuclease
MNNIAINHQFKMTITGVLIADSVGKVYLHTEDGYDFPIVKPDKYTVTQRVEQWQVLPLTESTGNIVKLELLSKVDAYYQNLDSCYLVGEIRQVSKKNTHFVIDINRSNLSLKPTITQALPNMKMGQTWEVEAERDGLVIKLLAGKLLAEGEIISNNINSSLSAGNNSHRKKVINGNLVKELTEIAQKALIDRTSILNWNLSSPIKRNKLWEWEARSTIENGQNPTKARVQINSSTMAIEVYQIPDSLSTKTAITDDSEHLETLSVTPLGAARSIGASCFQVRIGPYEIVLDAGTRPKGDNPLPAFEYLNNPNLILISHAHQDHIGALPIFHRKFPATKMICTTGTREIAHIMLQDCLKVQQANNEDFEQLFDEYHLAQTLLHLETQPIARDFQPLPGLTVRFINAGHIVGAACIYLKYGERSLLYTGDYNTTSSRTTDGLKLADLPVADMLITESTYGADVHPSRKNQETELLKAITDVVQKGGNVLIPAFALGRAQEIILAIRTNALFHSSQIPVYIDGLVRPVTEVFQDNLDLLPNAIRNFVNNGGQAPFFSTNENSQIVPINNPSDRPLAIGSPSVIIASSGMLTGGASVYYAKVLLERENAAIFISGYTDEESPGRFLQSLQQGDRITLDGQEIHVKATIRKFNLSAHADKVGLTQVIHKVSPKHLILIHGSKTALHELSKTGDLRDKYWIHIPDIGESITYGIPPEHLSQSQINRLELPREYEINIEGEVEGAWLKLPEEMLNDPRWQSLSSNGIIRAKWTKEGLMLQPISNRSLFISLAKDSGQDCCAVCAYFTTGNCGHVDSSLYNLRVDPRSKCLEFKRMDPSPTLGDFDEEQGFDLNCDFIDEI